VPPTTVSHSTSGSADSVRIEYTRLVLSITTPAFQRAADSSRCAVPRRLCSMSCRREAPRGRQAAPAGADYARIPVAVDCRARSPRPRSRAPRARGRPPLTRTHSRRSRGISSDAKPVRPLSGGRK
jgi:hypothetical protein